MKKLILCLLVGVMVLGTVACSNEAPVEKEPEITGTLEEIMGQIYAGLEFEMPKTMNTEVSNENMAYFLGTTEVDYAEGLASEAMISSIAHSVVLVKVNDGADIEDIKSKIKDNVDGRKWICVGVEEDEIIVDNVGNLVILIMDKQSEAIHQSFLSLAK